MDRTSALIELYRARCRSDLNSEDIEWMGSMTKQIGRHAEKQKPKSKNEQERELSKELEMSFPASDPPSLTQPGGGITGPEVDKSEDKI